MSAKATAIAASDERVQIVRCGAELVELSERLYRGLFLGGVVFVGLASIAALVLLPLRDSVETSGVPLTVVLTALLAIATPFAAWRARALYRVVRGKWQVELALVAIAAALIAYPLRSELWWPSCALLMLVGIVAPLRRTLAYCLVVLLANLAAHLIAGDLDETPAVAILGLWIGYPFWAALFSIVSDRFAAYVLRLETAPPPPRPRAFRVRARVVAQRPAKGDPKPGGETTVDDDAEPPQPAPSSGTMDRLTARQLQVIVLLVDGLRYREVAACLSISERQVQRHVANAIGRAGVLTANELVAVAVSEGLAPAPACSDHSEHTGAQRRWG